MKEKTYYCPGQDSAGEGWGGAPLRVRSWDWAMSARALWIFSRSMSPRYTTSSRRAAASWFSSSSCRRLAAWWRAHSAQIYYTNIVVAQTIICFKASSFRVVVIISLRHQIMSQLWYLCSRCCNTRKYAAPTQLCQILPGNTFVYMKSFSFSLSSYCII